MMPTIVGSGASSILPSDLQPSVLPFRSLNPIFSSTTQICSLAYRNNLYVLAGYNGSIRTSTDAITWTSRGTPGQPNPIYDIVFGNNVFVAASNTQLIYSADGITWTVVHTRTTSNGRLKLSFINNQFVLISAPSAPGVVYSSSNGQTWTQVSSSIGITGTSSALNVMYGNGLYLVTNGTTYAYRSSDLINWSSASNPNGVTFNASAFGNGKFLTVGDVNRGVYQSVDGLTWTFVTSSTIEKTLINFSNTVTLGIQSRMIYCNNRFILTSPFQAVLASEDGIQWYVCGSGTRSYAPQYLGAVDNTFFVLNDYFFFSDNLQKPKLYNQKSPPTLPNGATNIISISYSKDKFWLSTNLATTGYSQQMSYVAGNWVAEPEITTIPANIIIKRFFAFDKHFISQYDATLNLGYLYSSTDGINWNLALTTATNTRIVDAGIENGVLTLSCGYYSFDGVTFYQYANAANSESRALFFQGSWRFFGTSGTSRIYSTTDFQTWTSTVTAGFSFVQALTACGNGVLIGATTTNIYYSTNASTFTAVAMGGSVTSVKFVNGMFVVIYAVGNIMYTRHSFDGVKWTEPIYSAGIGTSAPITKSYGVLTDASSSALISASTSTTYPGINYLT